MARKFLHFIAICIVLALGARLLWEVYGADLIKRWMVPSTPFVAQKPVAPNAYADPKLWIARPDIANNPSQWQPVGALKIKQPGRVPTFFIHPTSFIDARGWNADLSDAETNDRARLFVQGQASVFATSGPVWAPRYRQAAFGAFLTDKPEAQQAIAAAYGDVALAFDHFVAQNPKGPIILAGHSQGALHLTRLMKEKVAGKPLSARVTAAYVIGWPVSIEADLPALGLPACATPTQRGCLISYQSFGEPAGGEDVLAAFNGSAGLTGKPRKGSRIICSNPLTGGIGGAALATSNLGMLKNKPDFSSGELIPEKVPARCDDRGFLLIGAGPELGPYTLPGNNYHVYDYSLFWANLRADALRRGAAPAP